MTNAVEQIDDHAVSQLEPVHEHDAMNDAENSSNASQAP